MTRRLPTIPSTSADPPVNTVDAELKIAATLPSVALCDNLSGNTAPIFKDDYDDPFPAVLHSAVPVEPLHPATAGDTHIAKESAAITDEVSRESDQVKLDTSLGIKDSHEDEIQR